MIRQRVTSQNASSQGTRRLCYRILYCRTSRYVAKHTKRRHWKIPSHPSGRIAFLRLQGISPRIQFAGRIREADPQLLSDAIQEDTSINRLPVAEYKNAARLQANCSSRLSGSQV